MGLTKCSRYGLAKSNYTRYSRDPDNYREESVLALG